MPLKCLAGDEILYILKEVSSRRSGALKRSLHLGYAWLTIKAHEVVKLPPKWKQNSCTMVELHSILTP